MPSKFSRIKKYDDVRSKTNENAEKASDENHQYDFLMNMDKDTYTHPMECQESVRVRALAV